jgi:hypothetical protein
MSTEILRVVYFGYVHSIINFGITFWGNQPIVRRFLNSQKG